MGLFSSLFGSEKEGKKVDGKVLPWIPLTALEQLDEISKKSATRTQMIFKHSTTCGISSMVFNRFGTNFDFAENQVDLYYLDLHGYRGVSDEIGYKFQVLHQSPQLLIIKNGAVVAHDSHGAITGMDLARYA